MVIPNAFLIPRNGHHDVYCFCPFCKTAAVDIIFNSGTNAIDLFREFFTSIPADEEIHLNNLFRLTLEKIVQGYTYRRLCLSNTHYVSFGHWVRQEPRFARMTDKQRKYMCQKMTEVKKVFDEWDTIVTNLTKPEMVNIDARKFSIHQFYRARKLHWCINYNEIHRNPGVMDRENPVYPEDKYQLILQFIQSTGLLHDIAMQPLIASIIGRRLQSDLTRLCTNE